MTNIRTLKTIVDDTNLHALMTVTEVADLLRVRPRWVYDAVAKGLFPAGRLGKHMRLRRADITRYIDSCVS